MSSDVCGWTLLRRGCDLQLTFKILQLEGVFFRNTGKFSWTKQFEKAFLHRNRFDSFLNSKCVWNPDKALQFTIASSLSRHLRPYFDDDEAMVR